MRKVKRTYVFSPEVGAIIEQVDPRLKRTFIEGLIIHAYNEAKGDLQKLKLIAFSATLPPEEKEKLRQLAERLLGQRKEERTGRKEKTSDSSPKAESPAGGDDDLESLEKSIM